MDSLCYNFSGLISECRLRKGIVMNVIKVFLYGTDIDKRRESGLGDEILHEEGMPA